MLVLAVLAALPNPEIDFHRDVMPILAEKCFACHGPDEATREADLRLDRRDELYKEVLPKIHVVSPGNLAASELWYRVNTDDENEVMPPSWSELPGVTDEERAVLASWIEAGAVWNEHWAFVAPRPAEIAEGVHPVDHLTAAVRGAEAGPPAERAKLARRLSLDLTGLPPSVAQVDGFLADDRADAYERLVERLLDSPAYGEHRARRWLDLARYADTNGYEKDERRTMWRYRDWVIEAFNRDLPFDEFTVEQLAGDLLDDPTTEQLIATGFHRNTMVNTEGGIDPEEFRVAAVIDRVNTTASAWMGLTLACAQCHSHKYDPFTQSEYYGLFAFFNSTQDTGNLQSPTLAAPNPDQARKEAGLVEERAAVESGLTEADASWDAEQAAWEPDVILALGEPEGWRGLWPIDNDTPTAAGGRLTRLWDGSLLAFGERGPTDTYTLDTTLSDGGTLHALRIDVLTEDGLAGRADDGNFVLTDVELELISGQTNEARTVRFAGATADFEQSDRYFPPQQAIDDDPESGWAVAPAMQKDHWIELALADPLVVGPDDVLRVRMHQGYGQSSWLLRHFRLSVSEDERARDRSLLPQRSPWQVAGPFTGDGAQLWSEVLQPEREHLEGAGHAESYDEVGPWHEHTEWIDGRAHALQGTQRAWLLRRTLTVAQDSEFYLHMGSDDFYRVYVNGVVVHELEVVRGAVRGQDTVRVALKAGENRLLMKLVNFGGPAGFAFETAPVVEPGAPQAVEAALRVAAGERTSEQAATVRDHFRREISDRGRDALEKLGNIDAALQEQRAAVTTSMVMRERSTPRDTFVLTRGSFLNPGEPVEAHTPAILHPFPEDLPSNRLGLARWLVHPENPLTARVLANRVWEELFGLGLVETSDDFGTRGSAPTNQPLLDHLACELIEGGWSIKDLYRFIVTSSTYKQDSGASDEQLERDPRNALLTRGPRYRLPAEVVRDNALAVSGLLSREIGGPSVFPPQPEGIWAAAYSGDQWQEAVGAERYRRGLYTFLRRTSPYPTYLMFDATSREVACIRRSRTNTPLQALAALNDPAFVEAAGALAERMVDEGGDDDDERLTFGMRLCVARIPRPEEVEVLKHLLDAGRMRYDSDETAALALDTAARPYAKDRVGARDRAPWIVVANALLNLDETMTKN